MTGYAVIAQVETLTECYSRILDGFIELYRAVGESPKPAVVVFQEVGGHGNCAAHCGEVMSTVLKRQGAIGLVSDCGVRDIPEVRALGFHYFARGAVLGQAIAVRPAEGSSSGHDSCGAISFASSDRQFPYGR